MVFGSCVHATSGISDRLSCWHWSRNPARCTRIDDPANAHVNADVSCWDLCRWNRSQELYIVAQLHPCARTYGLVSNPHSMIQNRSPKLCIYTGCCLHGIINTIQILSVVGICIRIQQWCTWKAHYLPSWTHLFVCWRSPRQTVAQNALSSGSANFHM